MPKLSRVLETALYVANLDKAAAFYADVMGLSCIHADHRMRAYDVGGNGVLLLFPQGGSLQSVETPGGSIPLTTAPAQCTSRSPSSRTSLRRGRTTFKLGGCNAGPDGVRGVG